MGAAALGSQVSIQNIPGLGPVQVISAQGLQQLLQQPGQTVHTLPGGAQIIGERSGVPELFRK